MSTFSLFVVLIILLALFYLFFFFNDTATTEIYTLSLHDALPIFLQSAIQVGRPVAHDQRASFLVGGGLAEQGHALGASRGRQLEGRLQRRARVEAGPDPSGKAVAPLEGGGMVRGSVPAEHFRAVTGPCRLASSEVGERHAIREVDVPWVARQEGARVIVERGDDEGCGGATRDAEDPLGICRDGETARAGGSVLDPQPRDLHRVVPRHELQEVERDAVRGMLEAAVALPMPHDVGPGLLADREQRRSPQRAALLIPDVQRLPRGIPDRIVGPGGELILAAVARPRVPGARFGDLEPEAVIRDHVDPGGRRPLALAQDDHVLAAAVGKAAEAVEELEIQTGSGDVERRSAGTSRWRQRSGCRPLGAHDLVPERAVAAQQDRSSGRPKEVVVPGRDEIPPENEDVPAGGILVPDG